MAVTAGAVNRCCCQSNGRDYASFTVSSVCAKPRRTPHAVFGKIAGPVISGRVILELFPYQRSQLKITL